MNRFTYKLNRLVYLEAIEPQWNTKPEIWEDRL